VSSSGPRIVLRLKTDIGGQSLLPLLRLRLAYPEVLVDVGGIDELRGVQERAEAFRKSDDRMQLIDLHVDDQGVVKIHSVYITYLLPMTIEVQYWEFPEPGQAKPFPGLAQAN